MLDPRRETANLPPPMIDLDRTQQRIVGVLLEKELAVPDSYPLTENALISGCNQKSNRDPEMGLEPFEVQGALNALMSSDWAKSSSVAGARSARYSHRLSAHHAVEMPEKAILCELLVRGPQASGALKPRLARLGYSADPAAIEATLEHMASRSEPLVERLSRRPRERDNRWRHLLGPLDTAHAEQAAPESAPFAPPAPPPTSSAGSVAPGLVERVERLEDQVADLLEQVRRLSGD